MAKWKVVATAPLQLMSSAYERQFLLTEGGRIISVAGIPFEQIPSTTSDSNNLLGRCDNHMIAVRCDLTLEDFEWIPADK